MASNGSVVGSPPKTADAAGLPGADGRGHFATSVAAAAAVSRAASPPRPAGKRVVPLAPRRYKIEITVDHAAFKVDDYDIACGERFVGAAARGDGNVLPDANADIARRVYDKALFEKASGRLGDLLPLPNNPVANAAKLNPSF